MNRDELERAIASGGRALEVDLQASDVDRLARLVEELERWSSRVNLTAIREREKIVSGHIMDSLAARPLLRGQRIIDVGTGAGFPGLPLALVTPASRFVLLDANGKKISFVRHAAATLEAQNVQTVHTRAEDYAPAGGFDTVIARALAPMQMLIELCGHLVGEDGVLLALKGRHVAEELEHVPREWQYTVIDLTVPGLDGHARRAVALTRRGEPT